MLIFVHVQKTAGTTLRIILEQMYAEEAVFRTYRFGGRLDDIARGFEAQTPEQKAAKKIVIGHLPYGLHDHLDSLRALRPPTESGERSLALTPTGEESKATSPQPSPWKGEGASESSLSRPLSRENGEKLTSNRYFTVLRDPIDRIISLYYYAIERADYPVHEAIVRGNMRLRDFMRTDLIYEIDNGLVRYLVDDGIHRPANSITEVTLEEAKANLRKHFAVVGLTEDFNRSLVLMRNVLGWGHVPLYVKQNVTRARRSALEIEPADREAVRERCTLDIQLYEYARCLFQEQVAAQCPDFEDDVAAYAASIANLSGLIEAEEARWKQSRTLINRLSHTPLRPIINAFGRR